MCVIPFPIWSDANLKSYGEEGRILRLSIYLKDSFIMTLNDQFALESLVAIPMHIIIQQDIYDEHSNNEIFFYFKRGYILFARVNISN